MAKERFSLTSGKDLIMTMKVGTLAFIREIQFVTNGNLHSFWNVIHNFHSFTLLFQFLFLFLQQQSSIGGSCSTTVPCVGLAVCEGYSVAFLKKMLKIITILIHHDNPFRQLSPSWQFVFLHCLLDLISMSFSISVKDKSNFSLFINCVLNTLLIVIHYFGRIFLNRLLFIYVNRE